MIRYTTKGYFLQGLTAGFSLQTLGAAAHPLRALLSWGFLVPWVLALAMLSPCLLASGPYMLSTSLYRSLT